MEPLTGNPNYVIKNCIERVKAIINEGLVREFYIGRTDDVNKRASEHGCDDIIVIYSTDSNNYAIAVEDALIKLFYNHSKCSNDAPHGGGRISEDYRNNIYVAIWYRD